MKELAKKLLAIQKDMQAIKKDSVNPHFKNRYFDINTLIGELKPVANAHGVLILQPIITDRDSAHLETRVIDADSGEELVAMIPLPQSAKAQELGSVITYYRRYALQSFFLLEAEDDDGETATAAKYVPKEAQATPSTGAHCARCAAPMLTSQTSGKAYCSKKCWLEPKKELDENSY